MYTAPLSNLKAHYNSTSKQRVDFKQSCNILQVYERKGTVFKEQKNSTWFYRAVILLLFYYLPCSKNPSEASCMQLAEHTCTLHESFHIPRIPIPLQLYKPF